MAEKEPCVHAKKSTMQWVKRIVPACNQISIIQYNLMHNPLNIISAQSYIIAIIYEGSTLSWVEQRLHGISYEQIIYKPSNILPKIIV